jgi:hypothetical protein
MRRRTLFRAVFRAVLLLGLALLVARHFWPRHPIGLRVRIASDTCDCSYLLLNLHITAKGELWMRSRRLEQSELASRLANIYRFRAHHVLYLSADDSVPFQKVAEIVDTVQGSTQPYEDRLPIPEGLGKIRPANLDIEIRLVTPGAVGRPCNIDCDSS